MPGVKILKIINSRILPGCCLKSLRSKGFCRIRFMTSHPKDLSDQLIETIGSIEKIRPHVAFALTIQTVTAFWQDEQTIQS